MAVRMKDYSRLNPKPGPWKIVISEEEKADLEARGIPTDEFYTYQKVFVEKPA